MSLRSALFNHFIHKLKDERKTKFFKDTWLQNHIIEADVNQQNRALLGPDTLKVADFIKKSSRLLPPLPAQPFVNLWYDILKPDIHNNQQQNKVIWVHSKNKMYTVKEGYKIIQRQASLVKWATTVWHNAYIPRFSTCA